MLGLNPGSYPRPEFGHLGSFPGRISNAEQRSQEHQYRHEQAMRNSCPKPDAVHTRETVGGNAFRATAEFALYVDRHTPALLRFV